MIDAHARKLEQCMVADNEPQKPRYGTFSKAMWDRVDQLATHSDFEHIQTDDLVLLLPAQFRSQLPESPMMRRAMVVALLHPLINTAVGR
jgi:hypothetical protein